MTFVGFHDTGTTYNSTEFKSLLLKMRIDAPVSTTTSLFGSIGGGVERHQTSESEKNVALF